ncbi:spore coat protein U domain-containing protein [Ramlibacter rhizophilus]|uniref:spore coat protein U domain-containing protein n=1 Tax=Ramlibacter rhizophilus TaxID=1781167 RepID=UPI0014327843|nr:spore coat protein U domain-containing protein [Ramlibacter rhizophilus]
MKHTLSLRGLAPSVLVAVCAAFAGSAQAQSAQNDNATTLRVKATISDKCRVSSGASDIAWTIDPADTALSTSPTAVVKFKCTKDAGFSVKLDNGTAQSVQRKLTRNGGGEITYTLLRDVPTQAKGLGFGTGKDIEVGLRATVTPAQYQDAASGLYEDSVLVVIEP